GLPAPGFVRLRRLAAFALSPKAGTSVSVQRSFVIIAHQQPAKAVATRISPISRNAFRDFYREIIQTGVTVPWCTRKTRAAFINRSDKGSGLAVVMNVCT